MIKYFDQITDSGSAHTDTKLCLAKDCLKYFNVYAKEKTNQRY